MREKFFNWSLYLLIYLLNIPFPCIDLTYQRFVVIFDAVIFSEWGWVGWAAAAGDGYHPASDVP